MIKPNVYVITGPNGAGKTTFANEFLPRYVRCTHFVNADLIAQGLSPFVPRSAAIHAGRLVLAQIRDLSSRKVDFAFETTLSGRTYLPLLKDMQARGYVVRLFFLWVPDSGLALARIRERVVSGGHDVPKADVLRRFDRSIDHFLNVYGPCADAWELFDNSAVSPRLVAKKNGDIAVVDRSLFEKITKGEVPHGKKNG